MSDEANTQAVQSESLPVQPEESNSEVEEVVGTKEALPNGEDTSRRSEPKEEVAPVATESESTINHCFSAPKISSHSPTNSKLLAFRSRY